MGLGHFDVLFRPLAQTLSAFRRESLADRCRDSGNKRPLRDLHALRNNRSCSHNRLATDSGSVQDGSVHADKAFVFDHAGMNNRAMPNRHVITDFQGEVVRQMPDYPVLQVRSLAYRDEVYVPPQHGAIPDAGILSKANVSDNGSLRGNEHPFAQRRFLSKVGRESLR